MGCDAGGDERMRDLQEHGHSTAQERRDTRIADVADHAAGREVPISARQPLGVAALGHGVAAGHG
jgi:hypothetical protein